MCRLLCSAMMISHVREGGWTSTDLMTDKADALQMALLVDLLTLYPNQEGASLLWIQSVGFGMLAMLSGLAKAAKLF